MTANQTQSADRIQALLDERLKVLQWIDKLNAATGDIPEDVRSRVKLDYQTRLDGVAAELQNYTTELQDKLLEHQRNRELLGAKEKAADTRLAEAKLRHAVGEFGEDQWSQLNAEISAELTAVRGKVQSADQEITKLEEVLSLIRQKPPSTQVRQAIPMVEPPPPPPAPPPPPQPVAAPPPLVAPPQSEEMAFISSVSGSGAKGGVQVTHDTPAPEVPPARQPAPPRTPAGTPVPGAPASEASGPQKTLKCAECGVMNFPTEWYCERCGAELAAL